MSGWIGVDLDGTLAVYDYSKPVTEEIGEPIGPMVERVKNWLSLECEVRIFTARASVPELIPPIEQWCLKVFGQVLPVTNVKDFAMFQLWDDRAVRVELNTGRVVGA